MLREILLKASAGFLVNTAIEEYIPPLGDQIQFVIEVYTPPLGDQIEIIIVD